MLFRPLLPSSCRYKISCSDFTLIAIRHYGAWKGMKMGLGRVLSCHPFAKINPS
ncbi:MAG: membrane protein insertion efficiency factor YidD [Elusimicrobiota bacterium]